MADVFESQPKGAKSGTCAGCDAAPLNKENVTNSGCICYCSLVEQNFVLHCLENDACFKETIFSGGFPYPDIENNDLLTLLERGYRMEKPDTCSGEL